jgi:hypothetical protein
MLFASHTDLDPARRSAKFNTTVHMSTPGWRAEKPGGGNPIKAKLTEWEVGDLSPERVCRVDGKRTSSGRLVAIARCISALGYNEGLLRVEEATWTNQAL